MTEGKGGSAVWRRVAVLGGSALLVGYAVNEMSGVLDVAGLTLVERLILVLFTVTFAWIAVSFVSSLFGFAKVVVRLWRGPHRLSKPLSTRTAVLMPTYNESPERIFSAIEAMARGVEARGEGGSFDWFILSDTTDPDVAIAEEAALHETRRRIGRTANVYYRRRRYNVAKKAGNVADFCRRWASAYDHMLVLDADSLIDAETIVELGRRMEADPDSGLIQTIPTLVGGVTIVARLQQFAGRVYGPVVGTGLAWWTQAEGNFWGHNAIIRTRAFIEAAGLPDLPGKAPFGGHILSHDFVEAALLRRAGWTVRIADDLWGSFEESPPSLVDLAVRDRRWCQGNLQHTKVLWSKGFHWVSRIHLLTGILSYLASPLWLLLILAGLALALQAHFIRPEYFTDQFQLFPTWPVIDAERALWLFGVTMGVLFGPKLLGLLTFAAHGASRRASGGVFGLIASFIFEVIVSALIAPIMMLMQTGAVMEILLGRDTGWRPQRRDDGGLPLRDLLSRHKWHVLSGILLALAAATDSVDLLLWLAPAILGLLLAVPLSAWTGSVPAGRMVRRLGLLAIPEETSPPEIHLSAQELRSVYEDAVAKAPTLAEVIAAPELRARHLALADGPPQRPRGSVDQNEAVAAAKIAEAASVEEAISYLTQKERSTLLAAPALVHALARLPLRSV
jgi:membrane glycosyltransferase